MPALAGAVEPICVYIFYGIVVIMVLGLLVIKKTEFLAGWSTRGSVNTITSVASRREPR